MNDVWVTAVDCITALGDSLDSTWTGLLNGSSAISEIKRFQTRGYKSRIAATIDSIGPSRGQGSLFSELVHNLAERVPPVQSSTTLLTATTKAGIDVLERRKRNESGDTRELLPSSFPKIVSVILGLSGKSFNISAACASSTVAIATGASLITSGRAGSVIVFCADMVTEFVYSGFNSLQVLSPFPARPFDKSREGLSLGEGAAFLHLMSSRQAQIESKTPLATIAGWGVSNDAFHLTAPAQDGSGLIEAVRRALRRASVDVSDISGISAHGTGTIYNDLMEIAAFRTLFENNIPPAYSVKGAIGHTFGAAGGIEVALGIQALLHGILPRTVGMVTPEEDARPFITGKNTPIPGNYLLTTNSGFGGVNAAIILKKRHISS